MGGLTLSMLVHIIERQCSCNELYVYISLRLNGFIAAKACFFLMGGDLRSIELGPAARRGAVAGLTFALRLAVRVRRAEVEEVSH